MAGRQQIGLVVTGQQCVLILRANRGQQVKVICHHNGDAIVRHIILRRINEFKNSNGRHRRIGTKPHHLFRNGCLGVAPKCSHVHPAISEPGQVSHNELALTAVPNLDNGQTPNSRLGECQFKREIARRQHAHVLSIHDGKVSVLIDHVGSG